jgi:hypothetical protein
MDGVTLRIVHLLPPAIHLNQSHTACYALLISSLSTTPSSDYTIACFLTSRHRTAVCTYGSNADFQHTITIGDEEYATMQYHIVTVTAGSITGEMETPSETVQPTLTWALQTESTGRGSSGSGVAEETEDTGSEPRLTGGLGRVMRRDRLVVGCAAVVVAFMGTAL